MRLEEEKRQEKMMKLAVKGKKAGNRNVSPNLAARSYINKSVLSPNEKA